MVGYEKDESLTPNQKLIAGCISGGLTRFCTQPLDIIKLRTQLQKGGPAGDKRFFRYTRAILKEEGLTAFWHGHSLGQIHSILSFSSQFYVYELTTKYVMNYWPEHKTFFVFVCGIFAGCCSATFVIPLEVIRVRQMLVKAQYGGIWQGAKRVYASGGVLAFYEGLGASLLQMGPSVGISFGVFRYLQPKLLDYLSGYEGENHQPAQPRSGANPHTAEYILLASSLAGSIAGFVSKTFTYPFDLAKRRLQISSHIADPSVQTPSTSQNLIKCNTLIECLRVTLKKEGPRGLFRGWSVTIYKAQLTSIVAFTSYELLCFALREHHHGNG